MKVSLAVL